MDAIGLPSKLSEAEVAANSALRRAHITQSESSLLELIADAAAEGSSVVESIQLELAGLAGYDIGPDDLHPSNLHGAQKNMSKTE